MSKADTTLKINPASNAELEFDVMVQGIDDKTPPEVRFVVETEQYDRMFKCTRVAEEKHKWCAKLPAMKDLKQDSCSFRVEVVVDGYFFVPAKGTLSLVRDPDVKFQTESTRPSVTTSFTVKQEDTVSQPVEEASGGGEVTGQYAPTNALLKPEYEPPRSHMKQPGTEKDDEHIDITALGLPVPGQTTDVQPEGSNSHELVGEFDPREVAERIIKDKVGAVKRPQARGTLFKRDGAGKPLIDGIDTPDQKRAREEKSARVKEILKTT